MSLNTIAKASLQSASRSAVETELERIINDNWSASRWLSNGNRYRVDVVNKIKSELALGGLRSPGQMAQYIAASAVLHAMDGWTFLGKALCAHIHGDCDTARHLAYYAELRAAMSLLASEGIGTFDQQHIVLKAARKAAFIGQHRLGTHKFVWEALDHWVADQRATTTLFTVIQPAGIQLADWVDAFSTTPGTSGLLAKSWIETWGLDIHRLTKDRDARNLSSYRPTELHFHGVSPLSVSVQFVEELWRLAEPNVYGFASLDAFLLRQALERKFKAVQPNGRTSRQARRQFRSQIRSMLHTVAPTPMRGFDWETFLVRESLPDDPILLAQAAGELKPGKNGHDLQVICRATLLLRVASGSNSQLLKGAGYSTSGPLDFWLAPLGERLGLWDANGLPSDRRDLWADIELALDALQTWISDASTAQQTTFRMNATTGRDVQTLSAAEIAGIWALQI